MATGARLLCAIVSVALVQARASAAPVAESMVRAAVETWVREAGPERRPDAAIERMEAYVMAGDTVAYIAHLAGGGFCLSGADDLALPVALYNPTGAFDQNIPAYQAVLLEIARREEAFRVGLAKNDPALQMYQSIFAERAARWRLLAQGNAPEPRPKGPRIFPPFRMDLDVSEQWDQTSYPFNAFCPAGDGGLTQVGPVPMAASLIMKYWEWPISGSGGHGYWWNGDVSCGGQSQGMYLFADFTDPFDWSSMPDDCAGGCSAQQIAAVAELCYETGISSDTYYGRCWSSTFMQDMANAYKDRLYYDPDARLVDADIAALTSEIGYLRPVLMSGLNLAQDDSHAWVVYGYDMTTDPDRSFLCHLGYPGANRVWYTYDSIPWPDNKYVVKFVAPKDAVRFVGESGQVGDGSPDSPFQTLGDAFQHSADGTTYVLQAGWTQLLVFHPMVLDKPCTILGCSSVIP